MRNRSWFAILVLLTLAPVALDAQRPRIRGIGDGRTGAAPLPPTAPAIGREMSYTFRRLAFSTESYPMISVVSAAGFLAEGSTSHWTSFGAGQRLSLRLKPWAFGTLDVTDSRWGGMTATRTIELGARFLPDVWDRKLHPYADIRYGYSQAYESYFTPFDNSMIGDPGMQGSRSRYAEGFGGIVGGGVSMSISRVLMLTVGSSMMQTRMDNHRISPSTTGTGPAEYRLTTWRHTIGLRWNPVKTIISDPTGGRI